MQIEYLDPEQTDLTMEMFANRDKLCEYMGGENPNIVRIMETWLNLILMLFTEENGVHDSHGFVIFIIVESATISTLTI